MPFGLVQNWQEIEIVSSKKSTWILSNIFEHFLILSILWAKKFKKKVSKSWNADKYRLGKYLSMNFKHCLLNCNPFWWSGDFLDNIGPSRSLCYAQQGVRRLFWGRAALTVVKSWFFHPWIFTHNLKWVVLD